MKTLQDGNYVGKLRNLFIKLLLLKLYQNHNVFVHSLTVCCSKYSYFTAMLFFYSIILRNCKCT